MGEKQNNSGFTEGQEALIERIVWDVWDRLRPEIAKEIAAAIKNHSTDCRAVQFYQRTLWVLLGFGCLGAYFGIDWIVRILALWSQGKP